LPGLRFRLRSQNRDISGNGVRQVRIWQRLLGLRQVVVESVELVDDGAGQVLVVGVRRRERSVGRCGRCGVRASGYDRGGGVRRWRHLDFGAVRVELVADAPRVNCATHGPTVLAVPWARHGSRFTTAFEDTCVWLAARTAASTVVALMRTSWRAVTAMVARVVAGEGRDRLAGLRRIGIDEIAYRKGQRYLTVVIDHDSGALVWAREGRNKSAVLAFFDQLGPDRAAELTHVSADGAEWIATAVSERAPQAIRCMDPYHVIAWASDALDQVRKQVWNAARGGPGQRNETSRILKGARWALWKKPERLTDAQQATLATIQATNKPLYRAYLLKEQLREVIAVKGEAGRLLLAGWLRWAGRSRLAPFVKLARTIRSHLPEIHNTLHCGLSNGRIEANNTHLRLLTRQAYGYHSAQALIAMAMLRRGGLCPTLPGRS